MADREPSAADFAEHYMPLDAGQLPPSTGPFVVSDDPVIHRLTGAT